MIGDVWRSNAASPVPVFNERSDRPKYPPAKLTQHVPYNAFLNRHTTRMEIHGSAVSLSFTFPIPRRLKKKKKKSRNPLGTTSHNRTWGLPSNDLKCRRSPITSRSTSWVASSRRQTIRIGWQSLSHSRSVKWVSNTLAPTFCYSAAAPGANIATPTGLYSRMRTAATQREISLDKVNHFRHPELRLRQAHGLVYMVPRHSTSQGSPPFVQG